MNKREVRGVLDLLVDEFETERVWLTWNPGLTRGWYRASERRISLGPRSWGGEVEAAAVHEFTHHLTRTKVGVRVAPHGHHFLKYLFMVVNKYYTDPTDYPWENEYRDVLRNAVKVMPSIGDRRGPAQCTAWLKNGRPCTAYAKYNKLCGRHAKSDDKWLWG